uniref:Uncharacterized protein n=1 Tax=Anguilla anguilla TaxID=7936 RepID=A0A0E9T9L1_ANGAN
MSVLAGTTGHFALVHILHFIQRRNHRTPNSISYLCCADQEC